jgi:hypothetical protein
MTREVREGSKRKNEDPPSDPSHGPRTYPMACKHLIPIKTGIVGALEATIDPTV